MGIGNRESGIGKSLHLRHSRESGNPMTLLFASAREEQKALDDQPLGG
jgi:hypothetical protein